VVVGVDHVAVARKGEKREENAAHGPDKEHLSGPRGNHENARAQQIFQSGRS